ncbi:hypothetical protein JCM3775_000461 [Rhodotorula graminis]
MAAGPSSARSASASEDATPSPVDGPGSSLGGGGREDAGEVGSTGAAGAGRKQGAKRGAAGEQKLDKDGNPKKKRKQLVACDSCRLRRVKCDKADKEGGDCSECARKAIHCTDTYVKNKPKVVRGGKLINQAKALYGDNGQSPGVTSPPSPVKNEYELQEDPRRLSASTASINATSPSARLASLSLGHDLGDHLVRVFFDVFQPQCPLVDTMLFLQAWENAGRVTENLSPANECLALVIQAWAARLTDHPAAIGNGAPSLQDLRNGARRDFTAVGNRREEFARTAMERAMVAVDQRGALRLSSASCCAALTLLEFLITWGDAQRAHTTGRYLLAAASEHLRNLQLDQCDDPTERPLRPEQASNGTLLWMLYTRDSLSSMFGGRFCSLTDADLTAFSPLMTGSITADVIPYITSSDPLLLSGLAVASIFRYLVSTVRDTVNRLTNPIARRQRVSEQMVQELWAAIDEGGRYGSIFRASVERTSFGPNAPNIDVWFRDIVAMRSQHLLGIHLCLSDRLREEEIKAATQPAGEGDAAYLDVLRRLHRQSDERFFRVSREYCDLLHRYGGNLLFSASVTVEYSSHFLNQLIDTPAWEQGGPNDYPWTVKVEEVTRCLEVVQLAGWSWGGFDAVCDRARQALSQQGAQLHHRPPPGALLPPISTSYAPGGLVANAPPPSHSGAADWPSMHAHDGHGQGPSHGGAMYGAHKLRPPSFSNFSPVSPNGAPPTPQSLPSAHSGTHSAHISPVGTGAGGMLAPPMPLPSHGAAFGPPGGHGAAGDLRRRTLPPISTYRLSSVDDPSSSTAANSHFLPAPHASTTGGH